MELAAQYTHRRPERKGGEGVISPACLILRDLSGGYSFDRHTRAGRRPCPGYPRLRKSKSWMAGPSPAMTRRAIIPNLATAPASPALEAGRDHVKLGRIGPARGRLMSLDMGIGAGERRAHSAHRCCGDGRNKMCPRHPDDLMRPYRECDGTRQSDRGSWRRTRSPG
jgi:hypothetical protein